MNPSPLYLHILKVLKMLKKPSSPIVWPLRVINLFFELYL